MPKPAGCAVFTSWPSGDGGGYPSQWFGYLLGETPGKSIAKTVSHPAKFPKPFTGEPKKGWMQHYTILAVGNRYRQDDGVGLWVGEWLREAGLKVVEVGDDLTRLLEGLAGADAVILIEAIASNAQPGTLHMFEIGAQPLPALFYRFSSHSLNLAEALELSRTLGVLPPCLIYGIEGHYFGFGEGLSLEVEATAQEVTQRILRLFAPIEENPNSSC